MVRNTLYCACMKSKRKKGGVRERKREGEQHRTRVREAKQWAKNRCLFFVPMWLPGGWEEPVGLYRTWSWSCRFIIHYIVRFRCPPNQVIPSLRLWNLFSNLISFIIVKFWLKWFLDVVSEFFLWDVLYSNFSRFYVRLLYKTERAFVATTCQVQMTFIQCLLN